MQQTPPSRPLLPFGDQRDWIVTEDMIYVIGKTNTAIVVPAGFIPDLASIPQALWSTGLTPTGQYGRAAIVHDYLYWSQKCTRAQADRLLLIAMKESDVSEFDERAIYEAVHLGGASAWKQDASDRVHGFLRALPPDRHDPPDSNMSWPAYQKQLMAAGVKDEPVSDDGSYCHYGDSTNVP
ncbi:MAG: DUF1353 domain-containing protein [Rhodanobacteraceae bacterium]